MGAMKNKTSRVASTLFGLLLAAIFLVLTFRNTDPAAILTRLRGVSPIDTVLVTVLSLAMMLGRGLRWWMLLPRPHRPGDHWAAQRATAISYGVNNVASRVGELARILFFKRDTGRDLGSVTTTVLADRLVFDLMPFALIFGVTMVAFRDELVSISPHVETAFPVFVAVLVIGVIGMAVLATRPSFFLYLLGMAGLRRFPGIWGRLEHLIADLSNGLSQVARPRAFVALNLFNALIWLTAVLYYYAAVRAFDIHMTAGEMLLVFSVSSLGVLIPSPGGVGSVHFFMTTALVQMLGTGESTAAAAAAYAHGVNYLALSAGALFFLLLPRRKPPSVTDAP